MALSVAQIDAIYQALYGRNPTTAELNSAAAIDANFGDQAVVTALVNSSETTTFDFDVYAIIKAATGVAPTAAQVAGWVAFLEQAAPGATPGSAALVAALTQMVNAFANSTQFQATYHIAPTAQSTNAFVTTLIQNTQGTTATPAQLAAWGTGSGYTVAQVFAEFATNDASIAAMKSAMVTFLTNLADNAAGIPAVGAGQVFTLTPAIDTFTTGTGNDIYNAQLGVSPDTFAIANTLNTGDTIKDSGTNNVLNVTWDSGFGVGGLPPNTTNTTANSIIVQGVQTWNVQVVGGMRDPTIDSTGATALITGLTTLNVSNSTAGNNLTLGGLGAGNGIGSLLGTVGLTNDMDFVTVFVAASSLVAGAILTVNVNAVGTTSNDQSLKVAPDSGTIGYATWSVATSGSNFLELSANGLTSATTLNVSGSGTMQLDGTGGADWTKVKTISLANETGSVFITGADAANYTQHGAGGFLTGNTVVTSYTGGSGNDIVDLSSLSLANLQAMTTLNGGSGAIETAILGTAVVENAGTGATSIIAPLANFQVIGDPGGTFGSATINMSNFPGASAIELFGNTSTGAGSLTVNGGSLSTFSFNFQTFNVGAALGLTTINGPTSGGNTLNVQVGTAGYFETAAADNAVFPFLIAGLSPIKGGGDLFSNGYATVNLTALGTGATDYIGTSEGISVTANAGQAANLNISGNDNLIVGVTFEAFLFGAVVASEVTGDFVFLAGNGTSILDTLGGRLTIGGTNAATINAATSGGLFMSGSDTNTAGAAGDVIAGSTLQLNVLEGSTGNDLVNLGTAGDFYITQGGADVVTIAAGHAVTNLDIGVGFLGVGSTGVGFDPRAATGGWTAFPNAITAASSDTTQAGFWGNTPGVSGASYATGTGTSADMSTVANFVAGINGDVLNISSAEWGTGSSAPDTFLGLVNAAMQTLPSGPGPATQLAIYNSGATMGAGVDIIGVTGTFASAAALAKALSTSFNLTFASAEPGNSDAHMLFLYSDASGNARIADVDFNNTTNGSSATATTNVASVTASDMVQLTGIAVSAIAAHNIQLV